MNWIPKSAADNLPDEVLAMIFKLLADLPLPLLNRTPPDPVAASRVNRRWRTVALDSPELWTNIRISHRSRSFHWGSVFVRRSGSYPLDISINLESYRVQNKIAYDAPIPLSKALTIVGPHIGRWRTLALRRWRLQLEEFTRGALQALRLYMWLDTEDFTAFRGIRSLDIDIDCIGSFAIMSKEFREFVGPASQLTTLVFRNFRPLAIKGTDPDPIDCPTIRSFAISFDRPFYYRKHPDEIGGFETFTSAFTLPNIEHLEIVGGFSGEHIEDRLVRVLEDWEAPWSPQLQTLRLEDMSFSRTGPTLIQSFSTNITA
ncbi:hypothetical protein B0H19DRAFT_1383033 [Mycena capillaripes]|nr:hypothetical protein B0H19DRAFT_1383033 [Mycena capillaripes]